MAYDTDATAFRNLKTVIENAQTFDTVIAGVKPEEVQDDNGSRTDSLPHLGSDEEDKAVYHNARMFSIEQFHQLFHLFLNRSKARKRLDINDADTAKLQAQVAELERWRAELENRWEERHKAIDNKFESDDTRFKQLNDEMTYEFNVCSKKFIVNDEREEETQRTFK